MLFFTLFILLPTLAFSKNYHRFQQQRTLQCTCVLPHMCNDDDVAVHGHGLINPRIYAGRCSSPHEICCDTPKIQEDDEDHKHISEENSIQHKTSLCGYSANSIKSRITSGTKTTFGEFPWNLIIQESGGTNGRNIYKCGASLIHPKVGVTAAHCVISYSKHPERLLVRAGEWNVDSHDELHPFQDTSVKEILIHDDYNLASLGNDIALLFFAEAFEISDNVGFICLATPMEHIAESACIVSGWGKDAHTDGKYSSILKKVHLPIVRRDYCLHALRKTRLGSRFHLHKSFICAGGRKNEDSCKGDGGSPLICPLLESSSQGRFVQVGIVSWGIECGIEGIPGIYVNVLLYLDWIENEMDLRDLDTSYFKA